MGDEYQTEAPTASSDRVCATHRDSCPAGQWTSTGVSGHSDRICSIIRTCAPGKYQTAAPGASSNRECSECGIGTYQDKPNEPQCEVCAAGKHRNAKVASSAEDVACSACATGKFQNSDGQTSCKECAAGRVQPEPRQTQCVQCGMGKYQPEEGKTSCNRCVVGKFRSTTPASNYEPEACVTCTNRQYTMTYKDVQDDTCKIAECPGDMILRSNKCVRDAAGRLGARGVCATMTANLMHSAARSAHVHARNRLR